MVILITGKTGLLGTEIKKIMPECIAPDRNTLDITNKKEIFEFFENNEIEGIIHTAAMTSIRKCEEEKQECWKTNVESVKNLVKALHKKNSLGNFLYVSTACVFQGDEEMYDEDSIPNPVNFYGLTKLIGESIVQTLTNHLVIRTNFVSKKTWPYEKAFTDRYGTYLFAEDVAGAIKNLFFTKTKGLVHVTGEKKLSMYELAKITTPDIKPMTMQDYSGPHLTKNMTLNSKHIQKYKISNV